MSITKWTIDPTHSEVGFKVKHMMVTNVSGRFKDISASIENATEDFETAHISFSAQIESIDTGNTDRDAHLKGADFFDAAQFPSLNFTSTAIKALSDENYIVSGNLEIKGTSKEIDLQVEISEEMKDPWGNTKIGLAIHGVINRKDFGLTWNAALETGGVLVSEEVKLIAEVQFVKN